MLFVFRNNDCRLVFITTKREIHAVVDFEAKTQAIQIKLIQKHSELSLFCLSSLHAQFKKDNINKHL